jgi:hypothetical protein
MKAAGLFAVVTAQVARARWPDCKTLGQQPSSAGAERAPYGTRRFPPDAPASKTNVNTAAFGPSRWRGGRVRCARPPG